MIDLGTLQNIYTVAKKIYDIIQSIKNAPEAIRDLEREVVLVQGVYEALKGDLEGREDAKMMDWSTNPRAKMHDRAHELLEAADRFLQKATKENADGSKKVNKIKWVLSAQADAKVLAVKFHEFYGPLCAVQSLIQIQLARRGQEETNERLQALVSHQQESLQISQQTAESAAMLHQTMHDMQEQMQRKMERMEQMMYAASKTTLASAANAQLRGINQAFDEVTSAPPEVIPSSSAHHPECRESSTSHEGNTGRIPIPHERPTCPPDCGCRCHKAPKSVIPAILSSLFGRLYLPQDIRAALTQPQAQCDEATCRRHHNNLLTIQYYFPSWFRQISAEIRIENQCSIHFSLRVPRYVAAGTLNWITSATPDEIKEKLWSRELTVNDVDSNGMTVLHWATGKLTPKLFETRMSVLALLMEYSAPTEWEQCALTPAESAILSSLMHWRCFGSREASFLCLKLTLAPFLLEDMDDAWERIAIKLQWTDLHRQLCALPSKATSITISPELVSQINVQDKFGATPLFYAALLGPEAVHTLLLAGANPRLNRILLEVAQTGADSIIGMMVRAGARINPLHTAMDQIETALQSPLKASLSLPAANELVIASDFDRHVGHKWGLDILGTHGHTPLEWIEQMRIWTRSNLWKEDFERAIDFYDNHRTEDGFVEDDDMGLPSTSLLRAGLEGNINAIGDLIRRGAMVNERDPVQYYTLLHMIAIGGVPNGYRVALELIRHGGWGVHWNAMIFNEAGPWTALCIAEHRLRQHDLVLSSQKNEQGGETKEDELDVEEIDPDDEDIEDSRLTDWEYEELKNIRDLLAAQRLPPGEEYLWPCMDPDFYESKTEPSEMHMPGAWDYFEDS